MVEFVLILGGVVMVPFLMLYRTVRLYHSNSVSFVKHSFVSPPPVTATGGTGLFHIRKGYPIRKPPLFQNRGKQGGAFLIGYPFLMWNSPDDVHNPTHAQ